MIKTSEVQEFLSHRRIAVVGASSDPKKFGHVVYRELVEHGYDALAVDRTSTQGAEGTTPYTSLTAIPGDIDGVIVMTNQASSADVVRECIELGITRIWLFKGLGGPGAFSAEAFELGRRHGATVIAGACPLMFLEPVGAFHTLHRGMRHLNRSVSRGDRDGRPTHVPAMRARLDVSRLTQPA